MYNTTRKKNPSSSDVMEDLKRIAKKHNLYLKGADPDSDYFHDHVVRRVSSWYYRNRLMALAYLHRRALKREESKNYQQLKAI